MVQTMRYERTWHFTFDARVVGFQVSNEVLGTGGRFEQGWLGYRDGAPLLAGTPTIHLSDDVSAAADVVVT